MLKARVEQLERENRQLREALAAAEEASRAKTDFLATMSHEIRTPLNGLLGVTAMLLDSGLDDDQRELVRLSGASGDALLAIINDILDLSKIEAGKIALEREPVDLAAMLRDLADSFAVQAAAKELDLLVEIGPGCPARLETDPTRLRQVLTNLVGNAIKFTATGSVRIAAVPSEDAGRLRVAVSDTGPGISPDAQHRLFAAYEQADAAVTRHHGGTGLGLHISRQLAGLLGGDLGVSSAPGAGSTFTLDLLLPPAPFGTVPPPTRLDGVRVLLACPTPALRAHLADRLRTRGAVVSAPLSPPWPMPRPGEVDVAVVDVRGEHPPYGPALIGVAARTALVQLTWPGQPAAFPGAGTAELVVPVAPGRLDDALRTALAGTGTGDATVVPVRTGPTGPAGGVPKPRASPPPAGGLRVLVAEDNVVNQKVATAMLRRLGHQAVVVADGRAAVEAAQRDDFDLVLMDCQMPEMDGWEATATLRAVPRTRHLPVLALTAAATTEVRDACVRAGMDGYLSKPVRVDELREAIETTLRHRIPVTPA